MISVKVEMPKVGVKWTGADGKTKRVYQPLPDAEIRALTDQWPTQIAVQLASLVRERVAERGGTLQRFPGYRTTLKPRLDKKGQAYFIERPVIVSKAYPIVAVGKVLESGDVWYKNSIEFHKNVLAGSYKVSGGMWDGLSIVPSRNKAKILFRGRSQGQERGKRGGGVKVSNALKAATVAEKHNVNVLSVSAAETKAAFLAVKDAVQNIAEADLIGAIGSGPGRGLSVTIGRST